MNLLTKDWRYSKDVGLLIIRVVFGVVLIYGHGFEKLSVIFTGQEIRFADPIGLGPELSYYLAGFAEGICAFLLIFGLFSRLASAILSLNFIVIVILHAFLVGDGFQVLELRFLYIAVFIALTFTGPGKISLDHLLFSHRK